MHDGGLVVVYHWAHDRVSSANKRFQSIYKDLVAKHGNPLMATCYVRPA